MGGSTQETFLYRKGAEKKMPAGGMRGRELSEWGKTETRVRHRLRTRGLSTMQNNAFLSVSE